MTLKKFAVMGNPIAQSKSPLIHTAFAKETGVELQYHKQLVEEGQFNQAAAEFFARGGCGLNITAPFKYDAFLYADKLTERAKLAEAVNTLAKQPDGSILGDNTDSVGLLKDIIERLRWPVAEKRVLFLGAGGAVRGVLFPFLNAGTKDVVIANRTAEKAELLAEKFSQYGEINGIGLDELMHQLPFDLIINGTSASLNGGNVPQLPTNTYHSHTKFYDMAYASTRTPFLQWVANLGDFSCADGLGMLLGQAAESFTLWTGEKPSVWCLEPQLRQ